MNNYKIIKNYKNLENHWINGKQLNFESDVITQKVPVIFTNKPNSNHFLFKSNQFLLKKKFYKNNYVKYSPNLNRLEFQKVNNFWLKDDLYSFDIVLWKLYLHKNNTKLIKIFKALKQTFQQLEKQNFEKNLRQKQNIFNNMVIKKRLQNFSYGNTITRSLLKLFIIKCSLSLLKKAKNENKTYPGILVKVNNGGFVFRSVGLPGTMFMPFSLSNLRIKSSLRQSALKFKILKQRYEYINFNLKIYNIKHNKLKNNTEVILKI